MIILKVQLYFKWDHLIHQTSGYLVYKIGFHVKKNDGKSSYIVYSSWNHKNDYAGNEE